MKILLSCALMLVSASLALGQNGQITGRVTDSTGAIMPGVTVTVTNVATGVANRTASNAEGYYNVLSLPPGQYSAEVQMQGFKPMVRDGIILTVDQVQRIDFTMVVGDVNERIEVKATAGLLDTATTSVSTLVPEQKILDLPLNGRNPMALMNLVAGVRTEANFGGLPISSYNTGAAVIGGGPPVSNSYMIDGIADEVPFSGAALVTLSVDATEEFRIVTHNLGAEYGRTGGGLINFISKSGTNEFHGTAYEFLRNKVLNANDFFANLAGAKVAPLVFNEYGATLGGPVVKNKTFFFFNWEEFRQRTLSQSFWTVPTAAERTGDFSQTYNSAGELITIYDPLTTRPNPDVPNQWIRDPFQGNKIPSDRISPVAAAVTKSYPSPNRAGNPFTGANNFYGQAPTPIDKRILGIRMDHDFTPNKRLSGRYTHDNTNWGTPNWYGDIADTDASPRVLKRKSGMLSYVDAIRPDLLVEARTGVNRYVNNTITRSFGMDLTSLGLPSSIASVMQPIFPRFTPGDVSAIGARQNDQCVQADTAWSGMVSLSKVSGGHTLKVGFESRVYRDNANCGTSQLSFSSGRSFTQGPDALAPTNMAGYGYASFLLGNSQGSATLSNPETFQYKYWAAYGQDTWKITPRLTLDLGLRWDADEGLTDRYNALTNFAPNLITNVGNVALRGGAIFPGANGSPRTMRNVSWTDFQPRLGFAYQVMPKTSVRGGYGIVYLPDTGIISSSTMSGFSTSTPMIGTYNYLPYSTLSNPFPQGIQPVYGSSLGGSTGLGTDFYGALRNMQRGYVEQWNFNVQREVGRSWIVELGYEGNHGVELPGDLELDYITAQDRALGSQLLEIVPNPYYGVINSGPLSLPQVTRGALVTQYPQFTSVTGYSSWVNSNYQAFTSRIEKRFSAGFSTLVSYTWSKLLDNNEGSGDNTGGFNITPNAYAATSFGTNDIQDYGNLRGEKSVSTSNLPQRLVVTNTWALPFGKTGGRMYRNTIGGWQANSILTLQSGDPIGIEAPAPSYGGTRPNCVANPTLSNSTIDEWFNTNAFAPIAPYTMGNCPRNLPNTRSAALFNWDFSVFKTLNLFERVRMELRGEFFNILNHPVMGPPDSYLSDSTFGMVNVAANNPRAVQLALKVIW